MNKMISLFLIMAACGCIVNGHWGFGNRGSLWGLGSHRSHGGSGDRGVKLDVKVPNVDASLTTTTFIPDFPNYPCWLKKLNTNYPGLVKVPYYNLDSCLRYCISLDQCSVVDYDYGTDPPCWIQSVAGPVKMETLKSHPRCTDYILDRSCLQPRLVPYSVELCWARRENYHYKGLTSAPTYKNLPACLNYCASLSNCVMVDFDPSKPDPCWVWDQQTTFDPSNFGNDTVVTNYLLDRTCLSYFNYTEVHNLDLCWQKTERTHYPGLEQAQLYTISSCLNYCEEMPNCQVIDFDTQTNPPCWVPNAQLAKAFDRNKLKSQSTTTNYVLDRSCL